MTTNVNDSDLKRFLMSAMTIPMKPLYEEIGEILDSSIQKNFREGGRYASDGEGGWTGGTNKWIESIRAEAQNGQTLQDTGGLAASITYHASEDGVVIGTNKAYGAIQQFGGEAGKGNSVILPPRPYIVIQEEDYEDIEDAISKFYERSLKR